MSIEGIKNELESALADQQEARWDIESAEDRLEEVGYEIEELERSLEEAEKEENTDE